MKMKKEINGQTYEYLDCIHHTTTTKFPIWQRILQLFGKPIVIESEIYTENETNVLVSVAKGRNHKLFHRKPKYQGAMEMPVDMGSDKP